jgi:Uma2 family endonuclease
MPALASAPAAAPPRMTYEEFLDWADGMSAEWVDGEVILMSPESSKHQDIAAFLIATLRIYLKRRKFGEIRFERFQMKTGPGLPGREPDVLFVAHENLTRLHETHVVGPADLVVEVSSLESRDRDRVEKYREYEQGGVREYWLIDPNRNQAQFFQLGTDNIFHEIAPEADGRYHCAVIPGVWVRPEWFGDDGLPDELEVLQAWGI